MGDLRFNLQLSSKLRTSWGGLRLPACSFWTQKNPHFLPGRIPPVQSGHALASCRVDHCPDPVPFRVSNILKILNNEKNHSIVPGPGAAGEGIPSISQHWAEKPPWCELGQTVVTCPAKERVPSQTPPRPCRKLRGPHAQKHQLSVLSQHHACVGTLGSLNLANIHKILSKT